MAFDFNINSIDSREYNNIVCPYCFEKFNHDQVIFRAKEGYEEKQDAKVSRNVRNSYGSDTPFGGGLMDLMNQAEDDEPVMQEDSAVTEEELKKLFRKFDSPKATRSDQKLDAELIDYWEGRGGEVGYTSSDPQWNLPHIDPASPSFDDMIVKVPEANEKGFILDEDGFVFGVVDSYKKHKPKGMTRLCPHCHNPLPGLDYGKYPVSFISVVGLTSAGKTVFIRQMLDTIEAALETTDYILGPHMINTLGEEISPLNPLPGSTDTTIMRRPISVTICKRNDTRNGFTLVFYDIAGENCEIRDSENKDTSQMARKISEFLAHSNGMFLLMDPEHLNIFGGKFADANQKKILDVLDIIRTHRTVERVNISWQGVPVAVCVTKSDRIADKLPDLPLGEPADPNADGFDNLGGNLAIHEYLKNEFSGNRLGSAFRAFDDCAYFAVSAISCDVETKIDKYSNTYSLDRDDANLFRKTRLWYMGDGGKVKGWNNLSEEDRKHRGAFPIKDKEGELITFNFKESVTEENSQMETEITATCEYDMIHLTLWDVLKALHPVDYPISETQPWRIHEPLKWMLWRMGRIGPKYQPKKPEPPNLYDKTLGRKNYENYLHTLVADNQEAKLKHYWGKIPEWDQ